MTRLKDLVAFLDNLLKPEHPMEDSSNNGLQVEGGGEVSRAVFSVDASLALFEKAAEQGADLVFVHHGMSWGDSFKRLTGTDAKRLAALFKNGISLYASHLPLDAHPEVGNNMVIARRLGLKNIKGLDVKWREDFSCYGELANPCSPEELLPKIDSEFNTKSTVFHRAGDKITTLAVVSGGGADGVTACADNGISALFVGEAGHSSYHTIVESGVTVITGGHYRTEIPGVEAVMGMVEKEFGLDCTFMEVPTGL